MVDGLANGSSTYRSQSRGGLFLVAVKLWIVEVSKVKLVAVARYVFCSTDCVGMRRVNT